jgi:hypothetical protein
MEISRRATRLRGLAERLLARLPLDRAALAGLQRLHEPQRLADRAPEQVGVVRRVLNDAVRIDDDGGAAGDAAFDQRLVVAGDGLVEVGEQRVIQLAEPRLDPRLVRVLRVRRHPQHLAVDRAKLLVTPRELLNLRRTDEGEVGRIEKEDDVLALVIAERHLLEIAVADDGIDAEVRRFPRHETHWGSS